MAIDAVRQRRSGGPVAPRESSVAPRPGSRKSRAQAPASRLTQVRPAPRNLFAELLEGVEAMRGQREGKITLRTHTQPQEVMEEAPGPEFYLAVREKFNVSRAVWARMLRVSPRTVEKWEQGGQVSPLAATFVELVARYPDTIERLQTLPRRIPRNSQPPITDH